MSRANRPGGSYVTPIKTSDGTSPDVVDDGRYTLTSSTTYVWPLGGADGTRVSAHVQWDAAIVITSITVEDSNFPEVDVSNYSTTAADWIDEDPTTAFVGVVGAGVTVTNGVVAVAGGAAGGAMFHVVDTGAKRTRLTMVVAGTGGKVRVAEWAKE